MNEPNAEQTAARMAAYFEDLVANAATNGCVALGPSAPEQHRKRLVLIPAPHILPSGEGVSGATTFYSVTENGFKKTVFRTAAPTETELSEDFKKALDQLIENPPAADDYSSGYFSGGGYRQTIHVPGFTGNFDVVDIRPEDSSKIKTALEESKNMAQQKTANSTTAANQAVLDILS
ncbi:hypothetical protein A2617_00020 [Candidatus Daviesbacteria bacterium RIFOXYD1_FULL_41_10]|uniref:Uncharacterized protein n=2 Tax=Candidatus Daviesiibacteriota TaxID=1752718 RepID=A0A1F5N203_9BACT|nr:MAG: hypothetical protein UU67_C0038G0011 [Candidatus Daviesbacteria bacterium GW2011_GWB1_41_5]OGE71603.1 MAG: hypothetical protein A2617_00020 [Candidatus Daviesbacteria bacterium RIFOXYD1_FULL_41_10]